MLKFSLQSWWKYLDLENFRIKKLAMLFNYYTRITISSDFISIIMAARNENFTIILNIHIRQHAEI